MKNFSLSTNNDTRSYFPSAYSSFLFLRSYARWIPEKKRRETWPETVDRYLTFMRENVGEKLSNKEYEEIRSDILNLRVMPSMRLLQFSGEAARRSPAAYNCAFIAPQTWECLSSILYVLMCGTGVGFMVSKETVSKLPVVKIQKRGPIKTFIVADSKEGWADAFKFGLETWSSGGDVIFDVSKVRPAGARLNTFGGFSSGPEPLQKLLKFAREKILGAQGKKLKPIELHDIICMIAEIVVCGGVRRSALISLSDLDDIEIRDCKQGQFWEEHPQRALSNNSAIYTGKPTAAEFLKEFEALVSSGSGERGIFNQGGIPKNLPNRRVKYLESIGTIRNGTVTGIIGTNPCAEILLAPKDGIGGQMCNLSEVICRSDDTEATLLEKIKTATLLGTYQSTLTTFDYLPKSWEENCKSERLLGVSLTGIMDCPVVRDPNVLRRLKDAAVSFNKEFSKRLCINQSTCVTTVKPSGTVSQLVACSSGLHGNYAPFYIRRIRITVNDPLLKMARDQGVPAFPEVGQSADSATTWVLEFPQKAPNGAILQKDLSALDQLEMWKRIKISYTEHNPSITVFVQPDEWLKVASWVFDNFDIVGGLSFLPASDHVYKLAPYEEITESEYHSRVNALSNFDLSRLYLYEETDQTEQKRELACVGGACEL